MKAETLILRVWELSQLFMLGLDPSATNFPWFSNRFVLVCLFLRVTTARLNLTATSLFTSWCSNKLSFVAQMASVKGCTWMKTVDFQGDYSLLLFTGERQRSTNYTGGNNVKIWLCGNCRVNVVNENLSTSVYVTGFSGVLKPPLIPFRSQPALSPLCFTH